MAFSSTEYNERFGRYPGAKQGLKLGTNFDLAGFSAQIKASKARIREAIRPAAQAGAEVIYVGARFNAPQSEKAHFFYGSQAKKAPKGAKRAAAYGPFEPGTLARAIYQVYSKKNSSASKAEYHISVNTKKAPYWAMVELGTSRAPAHPYLTRAIQENRDDATQAIKAEFLDRVNKKAARA